MKRLLLYIILIVLWILPNQVIFAEVITGKVVDVYTQVPIAGAEISIQVQNIKPPAHRMAFSV